MPICKAVVAASSSTAAATRKKKKTASARPKRTDESKELDVDPSSDGEDLEGGDVVEETAAEEEEPPPPKKGLRKCCDKTLAFIDQMWLQASMYLLFLITFQSLTNTMRMPEEFYMDKHISDTFIVNTFDSNHNTLASIRRIADIWEWSYTVLVAGLFTNADAGEWWPDGDGSFHLEGATPLSTQDMVNEMHAFDFTDGIVFKQVRARADRECYLGVMCFDESAGAGNYGSTANYGYGASEGEFEFWTPDALGANPGGVKSANPLSLRTWTSGGFVAIYIPFFSEELLPDEEGKYHDVIDFRRTQARPGNGRAPNYYCARYTTNGVDIVQKCNPDPQANSGVTRQMMVDMIDKLKRGHWIDRQTRLLTIQLQARSHNSGVRFLVRFMFELTQMQSVLPSFDMEALVDAEGTFEAMQLWMFFALLLVGWFMMLEAIEICGEGAAAYFTNLWNVMDWANFILFFQVFYLLTMVMQQNDRDVAFMDVAAAQGINATFTSHNCGSVICNQFGFYDLWEVMDTSRNARFFMSLCVCLQLLKIIKFTNVIVPKMSLMTSVLAKGCYDLLFFGIIFGISMFAFCMLFYIQLGSFMDDYHSQASSLIALALALFGDFPFEEILDNSRGYTNGILFLVYLFVAVFILLSMFLSILGEAQAAAREDENRAKEDGSFGNEYGVLGEGKEWVVRKWAQLRNRPVPVRDEGGEDDEEDDEEVEPALRIALNNMQTRIESSLKQRVTGLESRMMREFAKMLAEQKESTARLEKLRSTSPASSPAKLEKSGSASTRTRSASPSKPATSSRAEPSKEPSDKVEKTPSKRRVRKADACDSSLAEGNRGRAEGRTASRSASPAVTASPKKRRAEDEWRSASGKVRSASAIQPERKPSISLADKIGISPYNSPRLEPMEA